MTGMDRSFILPKRNKVTWVCAERAALHSLNPNATKEEDYRISQVTIFRPRLKVHDPTLKSSNFRDYEDVTRYQSLKFLPQMLKADLKSNSVCWKTDESIYCHWVILKLLVIDVARKLPQTTTCTTMGCKVTTYLSWVWRFYGQLISFMLVKQHVEPFTRNTEKLFHYSPQDWKKETNLQGTKSL